MECMASRALKPSLRRELAGKSTQQVLFEDSLCFNGGNGVSVEDFSVDDLLDFSNGEFEDGSVVEDDEEEEKDYVSVSSSRESVSADGSESESLIAAELAVPVDDVAELEWLSQFVDDPLPDFSMLYPVVVKGKTESYVKTLSGPEFPPAANSPPNFSSIPSKARTKRGRPSNRSWLSPAVSESSTPSSFSFNPVQSRDLDEPAIKKQKKRPPFHGARLSGGSQFQRRCSHCQVQKTPQWRTGPLGAKTLCNACGVRFKSNRLYPEYRPACSPTFSGDVHSNSHRKVLEMRKKRELIEPDSGLNQIVPSFGWIS